MAAATPRRGGSRPLPPAEALDLVGADAVPACGVRAAHRLRTGRDVLLAGGDPGRRAAVAVLAALTLPGPALWITQIEPDAGPPPEELRPAATSAAGRELRRSRRAGSVARAPDARDLAAVAAERRALREFRFHHPDEPAERPIRERLARARPGLVVVETATGGPDLWRRVLPVLARLGGPPLLTLVPDACGPVVPRGREVLVIG